MGGGTGQNLGNQSNGEMDARYLGQTEERDEF